MLQELVSRKSIMALLRYSNPDFRLSKSEDEGFFQHIMPLAQKKINTIISLMQRLW